MKITPIIGLEVHVELKTKSKMFCGCRADHFHVKPNTHTCPVCLGLPGALPVPNKKACEWCLKLGLALNCSINEQSFFERKNYFYPDLVKGYQITQFQKPFAINGYLNIEGHKIRINRAHMEEDTGKSIHVDGSTLLDFNRSGVPLVEIVSEPDIQSAEQAKKYLNKLQQIIRYIGISDADIEKGSMRCEPTVNVCLDDKFYTPLVEIKNVASLTGVMNAINYEIKRQIDAYQSDGITKNSSNKTTRGWDADKNQTFLQREKEGSADYRYFPEPDIPPIIFNKEQIEEIRQSLPVLPDEKIAQYKLLGLSDYDAFILADTKESAEIFDKIISIESSREFAKFSANLLTGPLKTIKIDINKINPDYFKKLFDHKLDFSSTVIKQLILDSYQTGLDPLEIAKEKNLFQVSDTNTLEQFAKEVIEANPKAVEDYHQNPLAIGFLVGQLMKVSKGSANPQTGKEILEKLLK
ncbi:MAG TPA: Asp-tRNA(Asn)/Glu-tRNA(Gln) amidotransferase subunit GatB [Candidatus Woesebacteria bacterium]|nr:Asp-tRNA(Asn)/Glu-tRNA(Gln) amidotransferase subunit GatB [Candidatus Woesebacteria bacterium]HPR99737.1 Asp-tRNA(Asn)/Glu-tRNA(Gln) amidotransferase subunit GatB [Candidatus Woesebacteria bacterium]